MTQPDTGSQARRSPLGDFSEQQAGDVLEALVRDFRESSRASGLLTIDSSGSALGFDVDVDSLTKLARDVYNGIEVEPKDFPAFIELLQLARRTDLLNKYRVNHLSYSMFDDHLANAASPSTLRPEKRPVARHRRWNFLGRQIGFPIGVAASGLTTNSVAVTRLLRSGYNVITYKTVRSQRKDPFPPPNWLVTTSLSPEVLPKGVPSPMGVEIGDTSIRSALTSTTVSTVNSFGVPSADPAVWMDDLRSAVDAAQDDQLVICSVLGEDYSDSPSARGLVDDFVKVANMAKAALAPAIELNLSCPNTIDRSGEVIRPLCFSSDVAADIVRAVREALGNEARLGIKLAHMPEHELVSLLDLVSGEIDFVTGINTVQAEVHRGDAPVFANRKFGGLGGYVVSDLAVEFVSIVDSYRRTKDLPFFVVGVGGVTDVASFERLYSAGADVVQAVSGVFVNTFLALDCVRALTNELPAQPVDAVSSRLVKLTGPEPTPLWLYAAEVEQPASRPSSY